MSPSAVDPRNQAHDGSASLPYTSTKRPPPALPSGYTQARGHSSRDVRPSISPTLSTRSAPSSPIMRSKPHPGLAPLSQIAPIGLPPNHSGQNGHASQYYQRKSSQPLPSQQSISLNGDPALPNGWTNPSLNKTLGSSSRPGPPTARSRGRSRRHAGGISSSSDTETEVDSDSTFVPGRLSRHKHSLSQPDLVALRSRLEGWAGDVARGQSTDKRSSLARARATPPSHKVSLPYFGTFGATSPHSRSHVSLTALRKSPSPRSSPMLSPMTPVLSSASSEGSSPMTIGRTLPTGGMTGSEDADDDGTTSGTGTDSPSSDSLSFSPRKSRVRHRLPERSKSGLGLSLEPSPEVITKEVKPEHIPAIIERTFQQSTLLPLRLLAIVPSLWGICVLLDALVTSRLWIEVWPWGVDLSPEALERLVAGGTSEAGSWRMVSRGDMALSIAWALCTAHFCFELTTGLTHRWRSYYPLLSTLLRLLSLQCLCWPATYLTLWVLGARRPLLAWVVIGVTTGWSRTVQMWVTSNVMTNGEMTPRAKRSPVLPPEGITWVERFTWGREWDWDAIAREVGWKVGGLLLVTAAWMFWGFESGRYIEVDRVG